MSAFARHLQSNTIRLRAISPVESTSNNNNPNDSNNIISQHQHSALQGLNRKEYIVHRSLLTQHLQSLHIAAHERVIDLEDTDDETLGYLLEFVYTGDYTPSASPSASSSEELSSQDVVMGDDGEENAGQEGQKKNENKDDENAIHPMVLAARTSSLGVWGRPPALHTKFLHPPDTTTTTSSALGSSPTGGSEMDVASSSSSPSSSQSSTTSSRTVNGSNTTPATDHHHRMTTTTTFMIHAKIYLLADRYGASTLKEVALQKLRAALKTSELEPQGDHIGSLVDLIQSVYRLPPPPPSSSPPLNSHSHSHSHSSPSSSSSPPTTTTTQTTDGKTKNSGSKGHDDVQHKLRQMVIAQTVHYLADLQNHEAFKTSLKDGARGEFVQDLLSHLMNRKMTF